MKKILIASLAVMFLLTGCFGKKSITNDFKQDDVNSFINDIYAKVDTELPRLQTSDIDLDQEGVLNSFTGLSSNKGIEFAKYSEPGMGSQAYSLVVIQTNADADKKAMIDEIYNNIDMRKWICVQADKLFVAQYDTLIIMFMAQEDWADDVIKGIKDATDDKLTNIKEK